MYCAGREPNRSLLVDILRGRSGWHIIPWLSFSDPEIGRCSGLLAEANVVFMTTNELVAERLETREEERCGGWEVGDGEGEMGDGHVGDEGR